MHESYILARRVLLDALDAIETHRESVVLVGAQAVYLWVGEADLAVAAFTTDGDLVIDPAMLADIPPFEQALLKTGFVPKSEDSIGIWVTSRKTGDGSLVDVAVDFLVPASISPGKGRRAAHLPGHARNLARKVQGLEGAVVDVDIHRIGALEAGDVRYFNIRVAGPAALLIAKAFKINDRLESDRLSDKDALDVIRILRGTPTIELAKRMGLLLGDKRSAAVAETGMKLLIRDFGVRNGPGVQMAIRGVGTLADHDELAASCEMLIQDLVQAIEQLKDIQVEPT